MYSMPKEFVNHVQLVQNIKTSEQFTFLGRQVLETLVLSQYGLAINTEHHLLLCLSCPSAVIPSQLKSHLVQQHHIKLQNDDRSAIVQHLAVYQVKLSTLPDL